ncbi:ABC transporter permease [Shewanella sp. A3A]|nr:ABC transporter permease [Shewanella ferrihydritica]
MFEFGPILRTLWRNKIGASLIILQSALTLAIVANATFVLQQRLQLINQPTGIDEQHLFTINVKPLGQELFSVGEIQRDTLELRQITGVVDASYISDKPLSGSYSQSNRNAQKDGDDYSISLVQLATDPHGLHTLGVALEQGRFFTDSDMVRDLKEGKVVVISRSVADAAFGEGVNPIGQQISSSGLPLAEKYKQALKDSQLFTVVGVAADANITSVVSVNDGVMFMPFYQPDKAVTYLIRCQPSQCNQLMLAVPQKLKQLDNHRIITGLSTVMSNKDEQLRADHTMVVMMTAAIVLVSSITGLGVIGLTLIWINRRRWQIGVRRALGATRIGIVRYFLMENLLVTSIGLCFGVILTLGLNQLLMEYYQMQALPLSYLLLGMACVWLLGLSAAFVPALRTTTISPAVATRSI